MSRRYIGFDIETNGAQGDDVGITCVGVFSREGGRKYWAAAGDVMTREEASDCVGELLEANKRGFTYASWAGLGFDFRVLAQVSGMKVECTALALRHVDMMHHFLCVQGYRLGLKAACDGQGIPVKQHGVTGADAPALWLAGEREKVISYVQDDAQAQYTLCVVCEQLGCLKWTSQRGKLQRMVLGERGWLEACEAHELPAVDTSWMTSPIDRNEALAWTL